MSERCQDCGEAIVDKRSHHMYLCQCGMQLCASCALAHEIERDHEACGVNTVDYWERLRLKRWNANVAAWAMSSQREEPTAWLSSSRSRHGSR